MAKERQGLVRGRRTICSVLLVVFKKKNRGTRAVIVTGRGSVTQGTDGTISTALAVTGRPDSSSSNLSLELIDHDHLANLIMLVIMPRHGQVFATDSTVPTL